MKFAYYPGCSAQSTCKELNVSTKLVAAKLGLELVELHSATCTGSRELRAVDPELFVKEQFVRLFARPATIREVDTFVDALKNDPMVTPRVVLWTLVSSPEYQSY